MNVRPVLMIVRPMQNVRIQRAVLAVLVTPVTTATARFARVRIRDGVVGILTPPNTAPV